MHDRTPGTVPERWKEAGTKKRKNPTVGKRQGSRKSGTDKREVTRMSDNVKGFVCRNSFSQGVRS